MSYKNYIEEKRKSERAVVDALQPRVDELLSEVPEEAITQIKAEFRLAILGCLIKEGVDLSNVAFEKLLKLSDSTISRFRLRKLKNHKKVWGYIEKGLCEDLSFDNFMKFTISNLSVSTLQKDKFYRIYYRKFNPDASFSQERKKREKKSKEEKIEAIKKQLKLEKKRNSKKYKKKIKKKIKKLKKKMMPKVHILATSKSSDLTKKLAKKFNCPIYDLTNVNLVFYEPEPRI